VSVTSKLTISRGFTLVELQVALLLVSLMTVLMAAALRISAQTWGKVTDYQDIHEHRFLVSQFVRRHLNNMRFISMTTDEGNTIIGFFGSKEKLTFTAPFPTFENNGALYWWTLHTIWNPQDERYQLVMDYKPYIPGQLVIVLTTNEIDFKNNVENAEDEDTKRLVVADNISLEVAEYFGRDDQGDVEWSDEWIALNRSPLIIRLQFIELDKEGVEYQLPEIAVAPRFSDQFLYSVSNQ